MDKRLTNSTVKILYLIELSEFGKSNEFNCGKGRVGVLNPDLGVRPVILEMSINLYLLSIIREIYIM